LLKKEDAMPVASSFYLGSYNLAAMNAVCCLQSCIDKESWWVMSQFMRTFDKANAV
jgi:hypothetical protein